MTRDPNKLFPHDHLVYPFISWLPEAVRPNHITIFRLILTPFCLVLLFFEQYTIGIPFFVFAALTDVFDGVLARKRKQITAWGTFYDPVVDKVLIGSVILLIVIQHINPIIAIGIIFVELMLILGGWYNRRKKEMYGANIWGKIKMVLQVIGVLFLLIALCSGMDLFIDISSGTLVLAIIFALVSLLTYSL
ncbi:CDP-alcohol phosphatidyltransferase family protein [Patescibacteria group bacterium]|nr:CDP-alcohol phosphatidyltransferase family protein [Patescibacteria group bacterium]